ncbi:MAG: restriction endonuclease subunit S [Acidobacteria bacterium]|nr:restriction endonuclease subunit S [Acidobacteriota bacterium]
MSFPRYPKYKPSGVEWLDNIPEDWCSSRFSRVINRIKDGTHGTFNRTTIGLPLLSAKNVYVSGIEISNEESLISEADHNSIVSNGFPRYGDILLTIVGTIGRSCVYSRKDPLAFQRSVCFLRLTASNNPFFFNYLLQSQFFQDQLNRLSKSAAQGGVYMGDVAAARVVYPRSGEEQTAIAEFLDRETGKIDELVAEQRRLIELLREKRQAVISHAVTKGLNPNAPLKPSGIQWLGDVPEHWRIVPLRWASKCCSGDGLSSDKVESIDDEGHAVRVIGGNGLMGYTDQSNIEHSVLAVGRVGALCGNIHVVNPPAWITDNALILDPDSNVFDLQFLSSVLRIRNLNDIASKTAQPLITGTQLSDQRIPAPPSNEQREISVYLEHETAKLDALTAEAERAIELLQERRTALISAAVTGKIDVRGLREEGPDETYLDR